MTWFFERASEVAACEVRRRSSHFEIAIRRPGGFFAGGKLKRIDIERGSVQVVAEAAGGTAGRGTSTARSCFSRSPATGRSDCAGFIGCFVHDFLRHSRQRDRSDLCEVDDHLQLVPDLDHRRDAARVVRDLRALRLPGVRSMC
jgi:hypothetical protein